MKNWLQKVIRYGTYLTVFLTPLLYFGGRFYIPYSTSKTFFFYGIVELIIVAWLFLLVIDNKYRLSRRALLLFSPLFVFIIWLTISGIFGVNPEMSFWSSLGRGTGLITIYHCLGLSLVVASLIKSEGEKYLKKLLFWFLNGSFAIVLSVWFGNEGLNLPLEFLQKSKGGGLIGNSSLTASYLIFAVFLGLFFLFISGISRQQKVWFNVVLVTIISSPLFLNIYSLFVTHKFLISARGAMLGICVGILIIVLGRALLSKNSYIKYIGVAGVIICLGTFIWGWSSLMTPGSVVHKKFTEAATDSRFIFWNIARQGIADRPLIGWGPENYSVVYQKFFNPEIFKQSKTVAEVWNDKAHSIFYEIGVAGGYPAIILYLLFLCSLIYGAFQAYVLGNINRIQASILWGLLAGYVCQNLFVFDSLSSLLGLFVLVGIIFGLNYNPNIPNKADIKSSGNYKNIYIGICLLIILIPSLIIFVILPYKKVLTISDVVTLSLNKRPEHYKELLNISPVGDGWEIGGIAEDAYNLYSQNMDKIKNDSKLLQYSKIDLEKLLEYLRIVAQNNPEDFRLESNIKHLYNIYTSLTSQKE